MNTRLFKAGERGKADFGWLKANYYFSFSNWYDPEKVHFGLLRVLNDDQIDGGMGFGMHPHDNMEIVTIPLSGAVRHRDNAGGSGEIKAGEIQIMSAGSGIQHSEVNASSTEPLKLFQVWIFPKEKNISPRYDQRDFGKPAFQNTLRTVVSPEEKDDALWINQDAYFAMGEFENAQSLDYTIRHAGNGAFVLVAEGSATIGETTLGRRDALGVWNTDAFTINVTPGTHLLVIDVPMN